MHHAARIVADGNPFGEPTIKRYFAAGIKFFPLRRGERSEEECSIALLPSLAHRQKVLVRGLALLEKISEKISCWNMPDTSLRVRVAVLVNGFDRRPLIVPFARSDQLDQTSSA